MNDYNFVHISIKAGYFIEILKSGDYDKADLKDYQCLIKKLIYLSYDTKPDNAFVISKLSKHNANLRIRYMKVAKKIVWYLKDIIHLKLVYESQLKDKRETKVLTTLLLFKLSGYKDSSYTKDSESRKLVMGYY